MYTMTPTYLIIAILAMAGITFTIRAMPALLPKAYLDTPWLHRLNSNLPLCVLVLLILTSLHYSPSDFHFQMNADTALLLSQIIALIAVLFSYHFFKQLFISMIVGIAMLNGCLWLFGY
ncbi:AzlD domain-containing protein [Psychrobacter sp. I-STPA6b]|uniref:AzlD domain-containing protein n=1 Tax=Psychrobacter sp. I-STPA6b TaxID=2585718 RepID=UPI0029CAAE34|nr:AzlD domain-containing protein [Psychrobacter sp. I-STPA6b]